jgi:hypothetical protein
MGPGKPFWHRKFGRSLLGREQLFLTKIYILLPEEVTPSIISRPVVPAAAVVGAPPADPGAVDVSAPPTIDPDAIDLMKERVVEADEAWAKPDEVGVKSNEVGAEAWMKSDEAGAKTAVKAGPEAWVNSSEAGAETWVKPSEAGAETAVKARVETAVEAGMKAPAEATRAKHHGRSRGR